MYIAALLSESLEIGCKPPIGMLVDYYRAPLSIIDSLADVTNSDL